MTRPALSALVLLAILAAALPAQAFDVTAMSTAERRAFRAEIRAYLLDNPNVLDEALAALDRQGYQENVDADLALLHENADALYHAPMAYTEGPANADVTIVAFLDYTRPGAARMLSDLRAMLNDDSGLRLILREAPGSSDGAAIAAGFALSVLQVEGTEAYKRAQDALFDMETAPDAAALAQLADRLGFDATAVMRRMGDQDVIDAVASGPALMRRLDLGQAPALVMDRTMVRGALPRPALEKIVAAMRDKS